MCDRLPVFRHPARAIQQPAGGARRFAQLAEAEVPVAAADAGVAVRTDAQHDVVADLEAADARSELLDDPRALVSHHHRQRRGVIPVDPVQVGVADTARHDADEHLVLFRVGELDLLDTEWLAYFAKHRSTHRTSPRPRTRDPRVAGPSLTLSLEG